MRTLDLPLILSALWGLSELVLAFTKRAGKGTTSADRGTFGLQWLLFGVGIGGAVALAEYGIGRVSVAGAALPIVGAALMVSGMVLRWTAILTLGRFFTVDVAIAGDHQLVRSGVYRWLRHPSYSGELLLVLGFGVSLRSWASLLLILGAVSIALVSRIRVEEQALSKALGTAYDDYRRATKRLIPFVY